MQINNSAF